MRRTRGRRNDDYGERGGYDKYTADRNPLFCVQV
jgi:hypothetical protein